MRRVPLDTLRQKTGRAPRLTNEIAASCIAKRLECVKLASALSPSAKAEASFTHSKRFAKFDSESFRGRLTASNARRSVLQQKLVPVWSLGFGIFLGFGIWIL